MQSAKLRLCRLLVPVIWLAIVPACCAQNAPSTSQPTAVLPLSQIFVDSQKPTDWNDPQWKIREVPNPGCNGGYKTSDQDVSLQELAGHAVKAIHVTAYRLNANVPRKEPKDIRQQVLDVWLGKFRTAFCQIAWAESTNWSINATVEFDDGKRGSLLTDGSHVRLLDHEGKFWFLRLLPAAQ
jgi:hypothetical protein